MEAAVHQYDLEIEARVPGQNALLKALLEALLHRGPEFTWHVTASDFGFETKTVAWLTRLDDVVDLRELT